MREADIPTNSIIYKVQTEVFPGIRFSKEVMDEVSVFGAYKSTASLRMRR
jgi:hypothetical protein